MEDKPTKVPSLRSTCMKYISKNLVTVGGVLDVMKYFSQVNWMIEEGIMLQTKCVEFMVIAYETIRHKKGDDAVREVVSEELMKILQQQSKEREESMRRTVILGKVVEREAVKLQASNSAKQASCSNSYLSGRALVRSVSGKSAFPYCSLKAGLKWPSGVDPSSREEYLSDIEFLSVFGIPFNEYQGFPKWKRTTLKKEKLLF